MILQTSNAIDFLKLKVYTYFFLLCHQTGFGLYIQYSIYIFIYKLLFYGEKYIYIFG